MEMLRGMFGALVLCAASLMPGYAQGVSQPPGAPVAETTQCVDPEARYCCDPADTEAQCAQPEQIPV